MIVEHPERHLADVFRGLKAIGYWRPSPHSLGFKLKWGHDVTHLEALPDPRAFIDEAWPPEQRALVADYLDGGLVLYSYDGWSSCRICDASVGGKCLFDGTFVWPSGFSHYLREHGVRPDPSFVDHVVGAVSR